MWSLHHIFDLCETVPLAGLEHGVMSFTVTHTEHTTMLSIQRHLEQIRGVLVTPDSRPSRRCNVRCYKASFPYIVKHINQKLIDYASECGCSYAFGWSCPSSIDTNKWTYSDQELDGIFGIIESQTSHPLSHGSMHFYVRVKPTISLSTAEKSLLTVTSGCHIVSDSEKREIHMECRKAQFPFFVNHVNQNRDMFVFTRTYEPAPVASVPSGEVADNKLLAIDEDPS